jgi:pimeloyl-ACP methyl ester carboxylesterase
MRDARQFVFGLILAGLALAACSAPPASPAASGGEDQPGNNPTMTPTATAVEAPPEGSDPTVEPTLTPDPFSGDGPWAVTFETEDGETLNGTLFGRGPVDIVLAPDYPGKQDGWLSFAEAAAQAGYRVLTFDFRGYAHPEDRVEWGDSPADLDAALAFLRDLGGQRFIIMGAGQGSLAAILAAGEHDDVIGLAVLSSPREVNGLALADGDLRRLEVPSLWIGARTDLSQSVEAFYELAGSGDKEVWIYEGSSLSGTFIFQGADQADLSERLLDFADRVGGGAGE